MTYGRLGVMLTIAAVTALSAGVEGRPLVAESAASNESARLGPATQAGQAQTSVGVIDPASFELADLSPGFLGLYRKVMEIEGRIRRHADAYGLDYDLARAVCLYESGGNARLTSWAIPCHEPS